MRFALEQLIHREQRAHPVDKSLQPDPRELGDREVGGKPSAAPVPRAVADYREGALATALHEHPIFIRAATFNAIRG